MQEQEAVKIFDLVVKEHMLPESLDKLVPMSFIGSTAVQFYQAKVRLMDQLGATEEQRRATLQDGRDAAEMLHNIDVRIGELLPSPQEAKRMSGGGLTYQDNRGKFIGGSGKKVLPDGITSKKAHAARALASPEGIRAWEKVKQEAEENDDIPTKTAVLNKIRADKEEARRKEYEKKVQENRENGMIPSMSTGEARIYLSKLREVVLILPVSVPKDGWNDSSFAEAKAMAEIVKKRLEVWYE